MKIWGCKIGEANDDIVPDVADLPMREAVRRAYIEITGKEPQFIFSGWDSQLTEMERAVVNAAPKPSDVPKQ